MKLRRMLFDSGRIAIVALGLMGTAATAAEEGPQTSPVDLKGYGQIAYVSVATGSDQTGKGTRQAPWASIAKAIASFGAKPGRAAVLVAEGRYPTRELRMVPGVDLYGGFDAADWSRDIWVNRTALDGEGKGRVLVAADRARLDGFEVTGGVVRAAGGGILVDGTAPTISNNILVGNKTLSPEGWNPKYLHETANDGGALYCTNGGAPVITHNLVVNNRTDNGRGAGLAFDHRCNGEVTENVIMDNVAGLDDPMRSSDGGGVSIFNWSSPLIRGNLVLNNKALSKNDAGGLFLALWSSSEVRDNLIVGNEAGDDAGGLFVGGQEHRYGTPLDPMPSRDAFYVKVIDNRLFGNTNSSRNSGATRITMETRGLIEGNVAALNSGFYIQRTETEVVNNTILEDFIFIETKDYLQPSRFDNNIVWGGMEYDTKATVTNSLFRDGFAGNARGEPTFVDDVLRLSPLAFSYSKAGFQTEVLLDKAVDPADLKGRVVFGGGKWAIVRDATADSLTLWGDMRGVADITVISRYRQTADSAGWGKGADAKKKRHSEWRPARVNKAIELLASGQPIYYAEAYGGYQDGLRLGGTWADYITYNMEHQPLDFALLKEFMRGLVDAGPTRSGHRTPAVIAVLPLLGTSPEGVEAGSWMIEQALAQGVHGVHLARARDPQAVKRYVQAARYPIHKQGVDLVGEGLRGWGSQNFAAWVWGVSPREYLEKADVWPLNPKGEIMLGVKIEDQFAVAEAERTLAVPGIAFAEHGPRDLGLSYGHLEGRADPPLPPEVDAAGDKVLALAKKNGIFFLDNVLPDNVARQLNRGVMIGAGRREDSAEVGRRHSKRAMPW